jgi:hypothetical protein
MWLAGVAWVVPTRAHTHTLTYVVGVAVPAGLRVHVFSGSTVCLQDLVSSFKRHKLTITRSVTPRPACLSAPGCTAVSAWPNPPAGMRAFCCTAALTPRALHPQPLLSGARCARTTSTAAATPSSSSTVTRPCPRASWCRPHARCAEHGCAIVWVSRGVPCAACRCRCLLVGRQHTSPPHLIISCHASPQAAGGELVEAPLDLTNPCVATVLKSLDARQRFAFSFVNSRNTAAQAPAAAGCGAWGR